MGSWQECRNAGTVERMTRIGIIGGGNIGEALFSGIIGDGTDPKSIIVADPTPKRLEQLQEQYGVVTTEDSSEAADGADYLFICVKPDVVPTVLDDISEALNSNGDTVVVSVAAGVTISTIEGALSAGTPVVRVMPNTPMLVGKGASGLAGGRYAEQSHVEAVQELLSATGTAVIVKEKDLDAVTAVSGSGPAYIFMVAEAMIDAGVNLGLPRPLAQELAVATVEGAATMMAKNQAEEGGDDPAALRAKVSSPGGTTAAATRTLDEEGLRRAFYKAMQACKDRSVELGKSD